MSEVWKRAISTKALVAVVLVLAAFNIVSYISNNAAPENSGTAGARSADFGDYTVRTGYTERENVPYAAIDALDSLIVTGSTHEEAIENLKQKYDLYMQFAQITGMSTAKPRSNSEITGFAPNDQIEELRPLVDEFWREILGTSYATSFVSNQSRMYEWEHYVDGGRDSIISRVREQYGVDIGAFYDTTIPVILTKIWDKSSIQGVGRNR